MSDTHVVVVESGSERMNGEGEKEKERRRKSESEKPAQKER